jgi:hypothetical protein
MTRCIAVDRDRWRQSATEYGSCRWVQAICDPRAGAMAPVAANTKAIAPVKKSTANTSELQRTTANSEYKRLKYQTKESILSNRYVLLLREGRGYERRIADISAARIERRAGRG